MSVVGKISAKQVMSMVERQQFRCAISGRELTPETASLDHITPLARGGKHELGNVWAVDHQINTAKGTLTVEEFVTMCCDVARHQHALRGSLTASESAEG
ncbi:MAG TPA: hypothetical protein PKE29_09975 [Phycisphaerales bacterium]|nr:hypothetical protein [Phycisphaerales bacterium]